MFDWCFHNRHEECHRSYAKMYTERGKQIITDEIVYCQCKKRGCPCYVPPDQRTKSKKPRRKSK